MVNKSAVSLAVKLLGQDHARLLCRMAEQQDKIESQWIAKANTLDRKIMESVIKSIREKYKPDLDDKIIIEFLFAHYRAVTDRAIESAEAETSVIEKKARLAKIRVPRSVAEIRKAYDKWRRTGVVPKSFKQAGKKVKEEYLKKIQKVWRKYSEDFRVGDEATQEYVLRQVKEAAHVASSRAKTIVRTETTNYYNETRREIYDQSDAVSHYLFLAIRDQRTTKWCSDRVINGKRGRHGLVYIKGDSITDVETPACHWNCRSEMVPLTRFNPRHRKLIEDYSMYRNNHLCHPLPEGWRS